MKIGILTFHSQLNYGGVLQCWALKTALEGMGHEVVVVDCWFDKKNAALRREFATLTVKGWVKLLVRGLLGCGDFGKLLRTIRTIRFVRGLGLTKEHFCTWHEIGHSSIRTFEHLDFLVVGSDQVWHCGDWGDPRPYLLEDAPKIQAISYAASFGMAEVPGDWVNVYKRGLARFVALSCREREGIEICRGMGYSATHVVDPTLLLDPSQWNRLLHSSVQSSRHSGIQRLVCYFISEELNPVLPLLEDFSERMGCRVDVLMHGGGRSKTPRSLKAVIANYTSRRVKIRRGYGPREFVRAFANATWVITDSFHAVMFSLIFNCNARFLCPMDETRMMMFARIEEFAKKCIKGCFFEDDVERALISFEHGESITYDSDRIVEMREASMKWLSAALKSK